MKKKLEAELTSIAHRILQMKNKSDLVQLHQETQKLYEKLSVLRFVDQHFSEAKPTIGHAEVEEHLAVVFQNEVPMETQNDANETVETANEASPETTANAENTSDKTESNEEAVGEIISGISENATNQEAKADSEVAVGEQKEAASPEQSKEIEPVAELDSPEEEVAPVEAATTEAAAKEDEQTPDPEPTPEAEPEKVEEPAEEEKPKEHVSENQDEPIQPEAKAEALFKPVFEWGFEAAQGKADSNETKPAEHKITPAQISFDDLLGQDYVDPVFVKPEEINTPLPTRSQSDDERRSDELAASNKRLADLREASNKPIAEATDSRQNVIPISRNFSDTANVISINKSENLNDRISKGITIGLNDRIAFMKYLFNNSSEDYNRVLSQLITFDTLAEAKDFIDNMVKPDYNNWDGKDEYEQRFMEIIEKKFS